MKEQEAKMKGRGWNSRNVPSSTSDWCFCIVILNVGHCSNSNGHPGIPTWESGKMECRKSSRGSWQQKFNPTLQFWHVPKKQLNSLFRWVLQNELLPNFTIPGAYTGEHIEVKYVHTMLLKFQSKTWKQGVSRVFANRNTQSSSFRGNHAGLASWDGRWRYYMGGRHNYIHAVHDERMKLINPRSAHSCEGYFRIIL